MCLWNQVLTIEVYISAVFLPSDTDQLLPGLNPEIQQYQTSHPLSAVAKGGFKAGMIHVPPSPLQPTQLLGPYGRLSKHQYFHAIVTNIGPTAKQSWVLHPSVR